jgi:hypothetical protein
MVSYGIQDDTSDLRFHVCVNAKHVYWFEPRHGNEAIETYKDELPQVPVFTGAIQTATGFLMPPDLIKSIRWAKIPDDIFNSAHFDLRDNQSTKGRKAESLVRSMIQAGLISLVMDTAVYSEKETQVAGLDVVVKMAEDLQVKCDWKGGHKEFGGSGNLFLQDKECNPLGMH